MAINIKKLKDEQIQQIIEDYQNGKSMRQIERDYNVARQSVAKYLEEKQIKTTKGNHYRKYKHQYDYFENIDTEEKAYWLGFMFADGYIVDYSKKYGEDKFGITLHSKDKKTLEQFKKSIQSTNPITDVSSNGRQLHRIIMSSQKTVDDLISHGCIKQKSLILKPPIGVPQSLIHHFIRGYFDGDGSISLYNDKRQIKTLYCGCVSFISKLNDYLYNDGIVNRSSINFGKDKKRRIFCDIEWSGFTNMKAIFHYMYDDATIYGNRKYNKFLEIFNLRGENICIL